MPVPLNSLALEFPLGLLAGDPSGYAPDVIWEAPRRGLTWLGRERVIGNLLREAAAMREPQLTRVRRTVGDVRVIDEWVARFVYAGEGIEHVDLPAGAEVELERVRILTLANGLVTLETAIETWTVLRGPQKPSESVA